METEDYLRLAKPKVAHIDMELTEAVHAIGI